MSWPEAFFWTALALGFFGMIGWLAWLVTHDD